MGDPWTIETTTDRWTMGTAQDRFTDKDVRCEDED